MYVVTSPYWLTGLSFVRAAVAYVVLQRISSFEPSSKTIAPRYLKLETVPSDLFLNLDLPLNAIDAGYH